MDDNSEGMNGAGEAVPLNYKAKDFDETNGDGAGDIGLDIIKRSEATDTSNISIHQCARDGNVEVMEKLLNQMSGNVIKKINSHDVDYLSALHYAARCNHYYIVQMLVERGADVNSVDDEEATPLHYAARYKRSKTLKQRLEREALQKVIDEIEGEDSAPEPSVVHLLVSKGANVNAQDKYGLTPLHFAATRGNDLAARDLLQCSDVNVKAKDLQKMTALHLASIHNNTDTAEMLLKAGASLRCIDEDGCTPLHHACSEGSYTIAQMLLDKAEQSEELTVDDMVQDCDVDGNTCLHYAVENGHYDVTKLCLDKNAEVNSMRVHYTFPIHLAAVNGNLDIVKLLVNRGARVDVLNEEMATPLHKSAAFNHTGIIDFLVKSGARIDRPDADGFTPLLLASTYGHVESVSLLIKLGADISLKNKNDKTSVYLACEENCQNVLRELLKTEQGKDLIGESDRYDNEPLHIAAEKGYVGIVQLLLNNGADIDCKNEEEQTPLHLAAKHGRTAIMREILKHEKTVVNDEDENSNTPLHWAALCGHQRATKLLLEVGADVEARNTSLWTPLDCAAARGYSKTARILLEEDSPVDPVDKTKTTPLHLACINGHVDVVSLLLEWNADVTFTDVEGNNCLDLAIENIHEEVAMAIVMSNHWEDALQNETLNLKTGWRNTPMRELIVKMPDVAEHVFHRCTTNSKHNPDDLDYQIYFNYTYLDDTYCHWKKSFGDSGSSSGSVYGEDYAVKPNIEPYSADSGILKHNHPLNIMVTSKREDLLMHPLVTALLKNKWSSFGRYVYYANLFVYCIFLVFLTGYIVLTKPPFFYDRFDWDGCVSGNNRTVLQDPFPGVGKYAILALAAFNVIREITQLYSARLNYLGLENLIEWVTYITAILLVIDFTECQRTSGLRYDWQWQIGGISIFVAWFNLVLFIQKFPRFGIYVVMFTDILKTFLQFFIVFFLFIIAFALGFHVLLQNQEPFSSVAESLIKTSVMMIGEFEYDQVFDDNRVHFRPLSIVMFVIFLILMSIIIMNLLVGLAVDDIKAVQEQAVLKRLAMRVDLALGVEAVLPHILRRKFILKSERFFPNKAGLNIFKRFFHIDKADMSSAAIEKALNPELDDLERIEKEQERTRKDIRTLQKGIRVLEHSSSRMESMLSALIDDRGLKWEEQDIHSDDED